jgi:prolyl oligopeptidase PreP (S9A serine peptidase family)
MKEIELEEASELEEAMTTINEMKGKLQEVNLLNAKLLYVNKVFKANNLTESQKVNVIAAFDKAETVKEVKLVFETVSDNVGTKKKETIVKEHKGSASKATGTTASNPEVIAEVSGAVLRMQKLAGIIK